jgi:hypothetical protein
LEQGAETLQFALEVFLEFAFPRMANLGVQFLDAALQQAQKQAVFFLIDLKIHRSAPLHRDKTGQVRIGPVSPDTGTGQDSNRFYFTPIDPRSRGLECPREHQRELGEGDGRQIDSDGWLPATAEVAR